MRFIYLMSGLFIVVILAACGGTQEETPTAVAEAPTEAPAVTSTPEPTATPVPTPTPLTLTTEEQAYFDVMYAIRDRKAAGVYSWDLLASRLEQMDAPSTLSETHTDLLAEINHVVMTNSLFDLALQSYLLSALNFCDPLSYNYLSCKLNQDQSQENLLSAGKQVDTARAEFALHWKKAQLQWDKYRQARGYSPVPTATPFPIPPVVTPTTFGASAKSIFGAEIAVADIDFDAWNVIKDENSSNDAPASGNKYIMMTVQITNRGNEAIWVDSHSFSIFVDGEMYEEAGQKNPNDFNSETLEIGASTSGNVSFEVPSKVEEEYLLLYLAGDVVMSLRK